MPPIPCRPPQNGVLLAFYDTAGSVKQLVELRDHHAAAIASKPRPNTTARKFCNRASRTIRRTTPASSSCGVQGSRFWSGREQDQPGVLRRESSGSLVAALKELAAARHKSHQDRVAPGARQALGVHLLRGLPGAVPRRGKPGARSLAPTLRHGQGAGALPGSGEAGNGEKGIGTRDQEKPPIFRRVFSFDCSLLSRSLIPSVLVPAYLEVVRHAHGREVDVEPFVRGEVAVRAPVAPNVGTLVTNPRYSARISKLGLIS